MKRSTKILIVLLIAVLATLGYFTHRIWVFSGKVSKAFEYTYAAVDCLIQQDGRNEGDIDILFRGYKSKKAYYQAVNREYPGLYSKEQIDKNINRGMYNENIPECKVFYSQYRCWMLDPENEKSVVNCGPHFEYTEQDIADFKKDPSKGKEISQRVWDRRKEESKKKDGG